MAQKDVFTGALFFLLSADLFLTVHQISDLIKEQDFVDVEFRDDSSRNRGLGSSVVVSFCWQISLL